MRTRTLVMPAVVSAALLGSGLLMVVASAERWWPVCKPGGFETDACLTRQDHLYDFVDVSAPWAATGSAAELAGVSMLLLALALAVLPSVLSRRPRAVTWLIGAVLAAGSALAGVQALLSGLTGGVVEWSGPIVLTFAVIFDLWPVWAVMWWMIAAGGTDWRPRNGWQLGVVFTLILATPLPLYSLAPALVNYASYDTTPWTEAVGGWLLVTAAVLVWPAVLRPERRRTRAADSPPPTHADGRDSTRVPLSTSAPDGVWSTGLERDK